MVCSTYCFQCVIQPSGASDQFFNLCIYICQKSLAQLCIFKSLPRRCHYIDFSNLIWGWKCLVPAWCCCCGPSSWLWCSCCAVLVLGCGCEWTPVAHRLTGSECARVCCGCCRLGSWGPAEKRWCAAGGSSSSGSRCLHLSQSFLYAAPCVRCWTWLDENGGCTPAGTNGLHIPLWWTVELIDISSLKVNQ